MADTTINSAEYYQNMQISSALQRSSATKDASLGMQDFIKLLVAQLQNQDMMNPMGDTEFIAQMAQFSSLQAINSLTELNTTSYAVSLIGKEVTAATLNKEGKLEKTTGVVTGVTLFEGKPIFYIGDKSFEMANIMTVGSFPEAAPPPVEPTEGDDPPPVEPTEGDDPPPTGQEDDDK